MVDIYNMKSPVRWTLFLILTGIVVFSVGFGYTTISAFGVRLDPLIASIIGGIISGVILIIFDIIVIQGVEYEDSRREEMVKKKTIEAMCNSRVREMIKEEIKKASEEYNKTEHNGERK
jgi:hypothetical protein